MKAVGKANPIKEIERLPTPEEIDAALSTANPIKEIESIFSW